MKKLLLPMVALLGMVACQPKVTYTSSIDNIQQKVEEFIPVKLSTDLSVLTEKEKQMLPILFETAQIMEDLYWKQAWGNRDELLNNADNEYLKKFIKVNYGPWERLNNNQSFVAGIGAKPKGAQFYPTDMTKEEFETFDHAKKSDLYTIVRRAKDNSLEVLPYSEAYKTELTKASNLLKKAAELAEDEGLKNYLTLRAEALLSNDYLASDMAWMDMKTNTIDFVVGPIETYEDALYGSKAAFESFILIKDKEWSDKLAHFAALLPQLQLSLPVPAEYKAEVPGTDSDLGAYDALYYAGDCNAGSKTIAINLPNDPQVHIEKGSRKLQLKNSMRAKFDNILIPISQVVIAPEQQKHVKFDAFFENTMFHEVAHGLGIKITLDGNQSVREAMKETASSIEEAKADILGLYMVKQLAEMGELPNKDLMDNYVTFMAGIFRSVRFGAASAHGKANMMRFNYFQEQEAFTYNKETGYYTIDFDKMTEAMNKLSAEILIMQGDGNYDKAQKMLAEMGTIRPALQADLDRIAKAGIPRDIVFEQGPEVIGL
ncbi:Zn-dependent hydrolase [Carboxylicivirga sp. A043]|uniref:dipeptidyl-peptidase 3 family protein n=1 Tax=Carboxylicivirga litoralis TaxID=2816963 RepID=UPI0021CB7A78|nr:Zn-dependent hydrolase [Carboxylicivirga sp. A043]MCU4154708.1 Zn-dependent hydrolase [Carboxylicivirga sp. A043]